MGGTCASDACFHRIKSTKNDVLYWRYYINRIYIRIINSNKEQVMLEKLLNQVSNMFLYMDEETIDHKIMEAYDLNKTLEEIRALGVAISIDDFGTD